MSTVTKVFESGIAMVSIDVDSDTNIRSQLSVVSLGLRSIMCVPLKTKNGTLGIIYVDSNRRSKNFNEADLRVLEALADHAAIAIENAQLQKSLLEKQRIEQELEFAAIIQRSFLPLTPPESEFFRLSAQSLSAKTVGGDFYDFISIGGQRLGIAIGDVSGKGIPAALYMARLISDFRFIASSEPSPALTLEKINEQLARRSRRGMFVTMIYILLDTESGEATCANAGHLPVLLQGARGIQNLNRNTGVPLGILPDTRYEEFTFRMAPGDRALLYTDGIIEAINMQDQRYTLPRVMDYMTRHSDDRPLAESLFDEVRNFAGEAPQHDDMTLLSIHRLP
jgi:sigma-B regulation protein RsbU (phosphoserine phosphatase)